MQACQVPHLQDSVLLSTTDTTGTHCLLLKPAGRPDCTSQGSGPLLHEEGGQQQTKLLPAHAERPVAAVREERRMSTAMLGRYSAGFLVPKVKF